MTQARALQSLMRAVKPLAASMSINEVADLFLAAERRAFLSLPVVDENEPATRPGQSRHPAGHLHAALRARPARSSSGWRGDERRAADRQPGSRSGRGSKQVTAQLRYPITEDFVLIDAKGEYCGLGTVLDLLKAMEARVAQRNRVLRQALVDLKESQAQLLQSEKMAWLGQIGRRRRPRVEHAAGLRDEQRATAA